MNSLGKKIKQARTKKGISQQELAIRCGWGEMQTRISSYESGRTEPSLADLENIARVLDVSPAELAFNSRPGVGTALPLFKPVLKFAQAPEQRAPKGPDEIQFFGHMDAWDSNTPLDDDEVELPLFREVELSAGSGQTQVLENHGAKLRFAKSTLRNAGVMAEKAACAFVKGNSMERLLPDGTTVGVNTGDTDIRDGKIYVIDHDGMLRVKYLHRRPGGGIKVVSENAAEHPPEEYTPEQMANNNIRIIGRVFWWSVLD